MALPLGEVLRAVRLRHPAYADRSRVPDRVLVEDAGRLQRRMALLGTQAFPGFLSQQSPIFLAMNQDNLPGTVAAGTDGGLPVDDTTGDPVFATAGAAPYYELDEAAVQVADFVATAVTVGVSTTQVQLTAAGRTINADVGFGLMAVLGPGSGPDAVRLVASNTADTWTVPNYREAVNATTIFRLVQMPSQQEDGTSIVATQVSSTTARVGYLTKLDASGTPYLDLTAPLIALLRQGMPLPPLDRVRCLEGTASPINSLATEPVQFPYTSSPQFFPVPLFVGPKRSSHQGRAAYIEGGQLYLMGDTMTWTGVRNLVLTYVPIPPLFVASRTVLDEYFLLPDTAYDALVAGLAVTASRHAAARKATVPDEQPEATALLGLWLKSLKGAVGARPRQPVRNR